MNPGPHQRTGSRGLSLHAAARLQLCAIALVSLLALAGCGKPQLVAAPNLYVYGNLDPFADVPSEFQTSTVDLLYATDRRPDGTLPDDPQYGYERSMSLAFGSCIVELGEDVQWETLVEASTSAKRTVKLPLAVRSVTEMHRFPATPAQLVMVDGEPERDPEHVAAHRKAVDALQAEVRRRLELTPRKRVLLFIHGYNNSFAEAAFRAAELWHFAGREGAAVFYTWPAGHPGMLRGYTHDSESGQFTNFHLKSFLTALSELPEVESIDILAHSRGTDVTTTAVKELILVSKARGEDPRTTLKFGHLILAAADISAEVLAQRYIAEELADSFDTITFYASKSDFAIGSAEWLFADKRRVGTMGVDQISERQRQRFSMLENVAVVNSKVKHDFIGHGYFLSSPATLSDVIQVLRYDKPVGAEHGRPLTELIPDYYIRDDDYPQKAAPLPKGMEPPTEAADTDADAETDPDADS